MYLQVVKITCHSLAEIVRGTFALVLERITLLKIGGIPWQETELSTQPYDGSRLPRLSV